MLDNYGFVAETNATNLFLIKNGAVHTPHPDACLPGITRANVIRICHENKIPVLERNISVSEFYNADEVFTTGSMGELSRVYEIDGRSILNSTNDELLQRLKEYYRQLHTQEGEPLPF